MDTIEVPSADGTKIGVERLGSGPPLVAVHGGTADRTRWAPVRDALAESFTLHLVDRRGRGLSRDECDAPYDIGREGDDLAAVLGAIGEPSIVVGHSYGGLVALEGALRSELVSSLVLYEPASATPGHVPVPDHVLDEFEAVLASGDRERALALFFTDVVGVPVEAVDAMRGTPVWQARVEAVHTALREGRAANAYVIDAARLGAITTPATVLVGTESPAWLVSAAHETASALSAPLVELEGQGHVAIDTAPDLFVAEVRRAVAGE